MSMNLTSEMVRAARALLRWDQAELRFIVCACERSRLRFTSNYAKTSWYSSRQKHNKPTIEG